MSFLSSFVSSSANHCIRHHGLRPSDAIFLSLGKARRMLKGLRKTDEAQGYWLLKYRRSGPHSRLKRSFHECRWAPH